MTRRWNENMRSAFVRGLNSFADIEDSYLFRLLPVAISPLK